VPPRLAEAVLGALAGQAERARRSLPFLLGDLREEYAAVRSRRGAAVAWAWYWAVALRLGLRLSWERWRFERDVAPAAVRGRITKSAGDAMRVELRQSLRYLARRPGFSSAIVVTVALAIAATTVAFAVVDGVLLEPLPYDGPERIVVVWERNVPRERDTNVVSPANFLTWRDRARSFSELSSAVAFSLARTGGGEPERIGGVQTTASFFRIFGATALAGRLYEAADDVPGADPVVVLSEGYWRRAFGADRSVIGRTLLLNGEAFTVIGVLPARWDVPIVAEFSGTGTHDVWLPAGWSEDAREADGRYLQVFGRLRPGATVSTARAEMGELAARLREEFPVRQAGWDVNVLPLREQVVGDLRRTLLVIFGAVCFVLLIACGNVANLLLARATARRQEIAVRSALGAGRARLLRQLLIESLVLSLAGGVLGLVLARWALLALIAAAPDIPRVETLGVDASVLAFALLSTLLTGLLFGLAPALHVVGGLASGLRDRGAGGARRGASRLRSALVVAQVALSLILLVGAGLLTRSFANRLAVGLGFDAERLLTAELSPPSARYDSIARVRFFEELVARVQATPGVRAASAITFAPLAGGGSATGFWPADRPRPAPGDQPVADLRWVHHDYLAAMRTPLLAGRFFEATAAGGAPLQVVINETGARQLWPGESALGKRIDMPWGDTLHAEVIGVVGDVLFNGPGTELRPMLYWDHRQWSPFTQMTLLVRTDGDPEDVAGAVRAAVRERDADLPVFNVRTMDELYGRALARPRFATVSLGLFALLALLLAGVGIYGVIAHATQQRAREIGIRLALGAGRADVLRMILRQGALLIVIAVAAGAAGALALTHLLRGLVFDVSTTDPLTFAAMAALLGAVGLLACWVPARRASVIDPVDAIRHEA
jgi:putative ABC transport system permease protein